LRIRTLLLLLFCGWLFLLHAGILLEPGLDGPSATVGDALLERAAEAGSANAVTTVVVSYRGFDTLGEVTVLFLAATGVRLLFPVLLLFGIYVIVHGHLSPGGGFQGGVIIATAFVLRLLVDPEFRLHHPTVRLLESLSGSGFVLFGLLGLLSRRHLLKVFVSLAIMELAASISAVFPRLKTEQAVDSFWKIPLGLGVLGVVAVIWF